MNQKSMNELDEEKKLVAEIAARWVPHGIKLGIGSGSTMAHFIRALGQRMRNEGLKLTGLPTSEKSAELARKEGIPLLEPGRGLRLDLAVDGADELDSNLVLIKGGGGALLREKVVASISDYFLIIADSSKFVSKLGTFPLPLEVVPFSAPLVMDKIEALGGRPALRKNAAQELILTDQNNVLIDCHFARIDDPKSLARKLEEIPGIAEHGLFLNYAKVALVADSAGAKVLRKDAETIRADQFTTLPQ